MTWQICHTQNKCFSRKFLQCICPDRFIICQSETVIKTRQDDKQSGNFIIKIWFKSKRLEHKMSHSNLESSSDLDYLILWCTIESPNTENVNLFSLRVININNKNKQIWKIYQSLSDNPWDDWIKYLRSAGRNLFSDHYLCFKL